MTQSIGYHKLTIVQHNSCGNTVPSTESGCDGHVVDNVIENYHLNPHSFKILKRCISLGDNTGIVRYTILVAPLQNDYNMVYTELQDFYITDVRNIWKNCTSNYYVNIKIAQRS